MHQLTAYFILFAAFILFSALCLAINFMAKRSNFAKKATWYPMWASFLGAILMLNLIAWNVDL